MREDAQLEAFGKWQVTYAFSALRANSSQLMDRDSFRQTPLVRGRECFFSYSKACDTFRPRIGQGATIRTGLGGKRFVHFFKPYAGAIALVLQHGSERALAGVKHGFRHLDLSPRSSIHIANEDYTMLANELNA